MSHAYHPALDGFHPDQIYVDGCEECEHRGENVERAISELDHRRFAAAWLRAADQLASTPPSGERGGPRSHAEMPMLCAMWAIQVKLETMGVPLAVLPFMATSPVAADLTFQHAATDEPVRVMLGGIPAKVPIR